MKRQLLVLLSFFLTTITIAQSGVVASGGDASGPGGSVSYSIGQVAYSYSGSEAGSINAGVQQPYIMIMVGTDENDITLSSVAFPNPVKNSLTVRIDDALHSPEVKDLSYSLYDIKGQLLSEQTITSEMTIVPMEKLANDVYLICIKRDQKVIKTFKIFKSN